MNLDDLTKKINDSMDGMDFITARKLIENNLELVKKNRQLLNRNARSLYEILNDSKSLGNNNFNRSEMNAIYSINLYASNFDLNGLKLAVKNNLELLMRDHIKHYLNEDAKALLTGMNVLNKEAE